MKGKILVEGFDGVLSLPELHVRRLRGLQRLSRGVFETRAWRGGRFGVGQAGLRGPSFAQQNLKHNLQDKTIRHKRSSLVWFSYPSNGQNCGCAPPAVASPTITSGSTHTCGSDAKAKRGH